MEKQQENLLKRINERLGLVIGLLLRIIPKETKRAHFKEQVSILHDLGLESGEIARILNRDIRNVSKYLSRLKKPQSRKFKKYEIKEK